MGRMSCLNTLFSVLLDISQIKINVKICVCVNMTSVADLPTHCLQLVSCCHVMSCDSDAGKDSSFTH